MFNDKFNIIQKLNDNKINYNACVSSFVENYLESEIIIIHPDLLYQFNNYNNDIIINLFKNYLKKLKVNVKNLIKKGEFSIKLGLNKLIENYIHKIKYFETIIKLNKTEYYLLFNSIIISDQIIISFLESELSIITPESTEDLKILLTNIKKINENNKDNYFWFLKLIGTILKTNIPEIKENIILKELYNIKLMTNYIIDIKKCYSFLNCNITYLLETINDNYLDKIITLITTNPTIEVLYNLFEYQWKNIDYALTNNELLIKQVKNEIGLCITNIVKNINEINEIYKLIKLFVILNDNKLLENHLLILINNPKICNNIISYINHFINDKQTYKILFLAKHLKEKDVFLQSYQSNLIKRLLSYDVIFSNEKIMLDNLNNIFGEKEVNKIKKIISDYEMSIKITKELDNYSNTTIYNKLIITSYDVWNINFNNGFIDGKNYTHNLDKDNNCLNKYINNYTKIYKEHQNKNLLWLLHYGEVNVTYNNIDLIMLPIQLFILELFNQTNKIELKTILENKLLQNYPTEYIKYIIESIEISGLLANNNDILTLTDNIYCSNLINIYYDHINETPKILENDLVHSRKDIICTLINHFLKIENKSYELLYNDVMENNKLFSLDKQTFQNAINYMIKQEYIDYDTTTFKKIYY